VVAAYVIHVLDESLLGGSFVEKVRAHWWPEYSWRKFFWFNTGYFLIMIASVVGYDFFGRLVGSSATRVDTRTRGEWLLASVVDNSVSGIFAGPRHEHPHVDEPLFPVPIRPAHRRDHRSEWLTSIAIAAVATVFLFVTFPLIQAFRKAKVARS
jgi:hypothetical protein